MIASVAGLMLAASIAFANAEPASEPQLPGAPQFVILDGVSGVPGDSTAQGRFHDVLRGVFLGRTFTTEKSSLPGRYQVSVPMRNRFALLESTGGPIDPPAYRVQLTLEWLPGSGSTAKPPAAKSPATEPGAFPKAPPRRAVVSVFALPPGVDPAVVRIAPARDTVAFLAPPAPADSFAISVGRNAALLVLEHLHHLDGELPDDERLRLDRASRSSAAAPMRR